MFDVNYFSNINIQNKTYNFGLLFCDSYLEQIIL